MKKSSHIPVYPVTSYGKKLISITLPMPLVAGGSVGPALAILMDGTGYGEDGTIWGGEFLEVTVSRYRRLGHLRYIPLPGGDMAVMEPWADGDSLP